MSFSTDQTVYPCKEHGEVKIPIQPLLGPDGQLKVYPEVADRGFFDIDYRQGRLVFRAKRYIGLIPISPDLAIHVEPAAPITNLIRMIERAGLPLKGLTGFIRGYQEQRGSIANPDEVYVEAFISALERTSHIGVLKRYITRIETRAFRGRLLLTQTIGQFRSRGINHRATFEVHELTENNSENQIIKHTALRLLDRLKNSGTAGTRKRAERLRNLLARFDPVDSSDINAAFIARNVPALVRSLPNSHRFYEPVMWLAYLISTNSGIVMERIGQAKFETVILDASNIFEQYIRKLLQAGRSELGGCVVLDGNIEPVSLFNDAKFITKPDYYFLLNNVPVAVADAKYKPFLSSADRYELLGFAEALSVTKTAFIVPCFSGRSINDHHGTTAGGKVIKLVGIDLAATDIIAEEKRFLDRLNQALSLS